MSSTHFLSATCHQPSLIQRMPLNRPSATFTACVPLLHTDSPASAGLAAASRTEMAIAKRMGQPGVAQGRRPVNALADVARLHNDHGHERATIRASSPVTW